MDLAFLLNREEQQRREKLLRREEQVRFGNARGALRTILSGYTDLPPAQLPIRYGDKGKPRLQLPESDVQFNLSHAGKLALLTISRAVPVGIDLEQMSQRKNLRRIARKVFARELQEQLEPLDDEAFRQAFYAQWTALEARVKAVGAGVFSHEPGISALPCINFQPHAGWCAAIAADGQLPPTEKWVALKFTPDLTVQIG